MKIAVRRSTFERMSAVHLTGVLTDRPVIGRYAVLLEISSRLLHRLESAQENLGLPSMDAALERILDDFDRLPPAPRMLIVAADREGKPVRVLRDIEGRP